MNMQNLMAQAQKLQREITTKKEKINGMIFPGKYEWVEVSFNGNKEIQSFKILKSGVITEEDKDILEDMILLAIKDSFKKIDEETEKELGKYSAMNGMF
ncbi:MAG: YbaB/EbfC family nucleoid-associated protein [Bacilli bacterium]